MHINKNLLFQFSTLSTIILASSCFHFAVAAPGTLSDEPLQTSAIAEPNLMFIIDTSGSMRHVVPEESTTDTDKYNPNTTYISSCASAGKRPKDRSDASPDSLYIRIISNKPKVGYTRTASTHYEIGNASGKICFDTDKFYNASLYADGGTSAAGSATAIYKGNYLNWYFDFDNTSTNWDAGQQLKPGTDYRMNITRDTLYDLFGTLKNLRVGLATLNGSSGAIVRQSVEPISSGLTNLQTTINGLTHGGVTPLSEALHQIGRYYVGETGTVNPGNLTTTSTTNGQYGGNLILHPDAVSPVTKDDDTVFNVSPAYSSGESSDSPIQYSCQSNFAIVMTDGVSRDDQNISSTTGLQDYDGDCVSASPSCLTYDRKDATNYIYDVNGSDYLDDVAQALYEIDLRPDIDNIDGTEIKNNVSTYTIAFADLDALNNDLLKDAASQSGGEALTAESASDLREKFESATNSIIDATSSSSAVTFNSANLSSNSAVFQALFNTVRWSGEVLSIPLNGLTGDILKTCVKGVDPGCWSASTAIDSQTHTDRQIMTYTSGNKGIEFIAPADYTTLSSTTLPSALIDDLCQGPDIPYPCNASTTADATQKAANQAYMGQLIDYLRGDRSREDQGTAPNFRLRTNVLGDIVNASPIYIGRPVLHRQRPNLSPFPTGTDAYHEWAETTALKDRKTVVYAASNDGMLHAIDGNDGTELMAYIPTGTFSSNATDGLHYLADPVYAHRFYVDLTPVISDVWMKHRAADGSVTADPAWRSVLLGGQRGGGRSMFLLDITDPNKFADVGTNADELVLWEFTHDELGYTYSKPTITMMNNGKFAAVFGNGYNSGIDGAGDCKAKLFIVYLEGGVDGSWAEAGDYQIIDTKAGGTGTDCNGLSTPTLVDLDGNGTTDRAYAGDLRGNMWAFDLCNLGNNPKACQATGWGVGYGNTTTPEPMMIAKDLSSVVQPITVKPAVSLDPLTDNGQDVIVAFGTGQYLTSDDLTNTQLQSVYAVREQDAIANGNKNNKSMNPRSEFTLQVFDNQNCIDGGDDDQGGCGRDPADGNLEGRTVVQPSAAPNNRGWMIDLYDDKTAAGSGERIVVNPKIRNNILFINSLIPDVQACNAGGDGWVMAFKLVDGDEPDDPVFDVHQDGIFDDKDRIAADAVAGIRKGYPGESTFLGGNMYTPCGDGKICKDNVNVGHAQREGRMSWKELYEEK